MTAAKQREQSSSPAARVPAQVRSLIDDAQEPLICVTCGQMKAIDEFYVIRGSMWDGYYPSNRCIACCQAALARAKVR